MLKNMDPLALSLLIIDKSIISKLYEIKSPDIFEPNSTEFKKDGLFSETIFGTQGSKERMTNFAYIDLNVKVLHPRAFIELTSLSNFYKDIIYGKSYATFDNETKDFIPSNQIDGDTGYSFFIKHFEDIDFKTTDSLKRKFKIFFLKKYTLQDLLIDKYLVIPAGMRDYMITESGKTLEHEINGLYRKVLRAGNAAKQFKDDTSNNDFLNAVRLRVQLSIVEVYEYIENLLKNKGGFIQSKWLKRSINYGTRNVITAPSNEITDLSDPNRTRSFTVEVGVLQAAKGLLPITLFQLRNSLLFDVFDPESTRAMLINPKTYKREYKEISETSRSKWVSDEGLEETINKLIRPDILVKEIVIDGYYLLLIEEDGDNIRIIGDIEKYPNIDKKKLRPITYIELVYLALFNIIEDYPAFVTRYPITGQGSIDVVETTVKPTVKTVKKNVYMRNSSTPIVAKNYPILGEQPFTGLSIPFCLLEGLSADFDGDKVSLNYVWEEESLQELKKTLNSRKNYISPENEIIFPAETLTNKIIMKLFTE